MTDNDGDSPMDERISFYALRMEDDENVRYFNEVYDDAFPDYEQRTREGRGTILRAAPTFRAWVLSYQGRNAGILGGWQVGEWFYIEHFAVDNALRGQGIGKLAMDEINTRFAQVILEIDPPQDTVSRNRLAFYQGRGYVTNGVNHAHPSYKPAYQPHVLEVLSFPRRLTAAEYDAFNQQLQQVVMAEQGL